MAGVTWNVWCMRAKALSGVIKRSLRTRTADRQSFGPTPMGLCINPTRRRLAVATQVRIDRMSSGSLRRAVVYQTAALRAIRPVSLNSAAGRAEPPSSADPPARATHAEVHLRRARATVPLGARTRAESLSGWAPPAPSCSPPFAEIALVPRDRHALIFVNSRARFARRQKCDINA